MILLIQNSLANLSSSCLLSDLITGSPRFVQRKTFRYKKEISHHRGSNLQVKVDLVRPLPFFRDGFCNLENFLYQNKCNFEKSPTAYDPF